MTQPIHVYSKNYGEVRTWRPFRVAPPVDAELGEGPWIYLGEFYPKGKR